MVNKGEIKQKILIMEGNALVAFELRLLLTNAGYTVCGAVDSVREALKIFEHHKPDMVLIDIIPGSEEVSINWGMQLNAKDIPFIYLSENFQANFMEKVKATDPYGFIVKPYREVDLLITLDVALHRYQNGMEALLRRAEIIKSEFQNITNNNMGWKEKLLQMAATFQSRIPFDFLSINAESAETGLFNTINFLRIGLNEYQEIGSENFLQRTHLKLSDIQSLQKDLVIDTDIAFFNGDQFIKTWPKYPLQKLVAGIFNLKSMLTLPIQMKNGEMWSFSFYSRKTDCYTKQHVIIGNHIKPALEQVMNTIVRAEYFTQVLFPENKSYKTHSNLINDKGFEDIIGKSDQMLNVFNYVSKVAPTDTSVLIFGESGTGKEKIAKRIYQLSSRKNQPFVVIDCASLPIHIAESILFGHEKGSFTGALEKRIGKFEQAHKGTVFLDEIGELPLELQVKLLRVLQEKEIDRIGGKNSIKIDVRIIAASNRDLAKEVSQGNFRLDLYYRLNIFPILIPPLRERVEDIPELVSFFIEKYSQKMGKKVERVSSKLLQEMVGHHWPGNIRELEHFLERAVLLASTPIINENGSHTYFQKKVIHAGHVKAMDENERDHILNVLKICKGKVAGVGGAAELLKIPSTTLNSKMKKLGIKRDFI
ncbi:MAG: sigma-54-dependent Fis family transcriptional regulator [Mucilaginibacter sp.]|uniref:sigma-54 dependent transcriptional regulator n=1 Tax=Mucilaginibacter sp. TaxID=1882438 RepID=UPI0031A4A0C9